jgi:hypothetical protein
LAGCTRLAVDPFRLLPFVDLAFDDSVADLHGQAIDGGVVGQRQHVDGFNVARARIQEALRDAHTRDDAGHGDPQIGLERCRGRERAAELEQQAARRLCYSAARRLRRQRRVEQEPGGERQH